MGLAPLGYALDVALIATCAFWISQNPFVQPYVADPSALVKDATSTFNNLKVTLSSPESRNAWAQDVYNYVAGYDKGQLAETNPELHQLYELNEWKNSLLLPESVRARTSHTFAMWLRNYVAIHIVYFGIGALWAYMIYHALGYHFFPKGTRRPTWKEIGEQMVVSMKALPFYCAVPTVGEWLAEKGWTRAYLSLDNVGGLTGYLMWTAIYLFFVEWAIYW
jgi:hypothetical protein